MADAIVQTIKIEVDGADQAAAEIKKVGQATEEVQATAASTAGGTQQLGQGLDQVSQKSGVSSRELRSLGKIMKEMGAGELAGTAVGIARIGMTLGTLGAAIFAAAAAFSFFKSKMKEAEDQLKATTATMAEFAKVNAEMHPELAGGKDASNNIALIADELGNLGKVANRTTFSTISALTSPETMAKSIVTALDTAKISIDDIGANADKLGANFRKATLELARMREGLSPIGQTIFDDALKRLKGAPEVIKELEKGSAALAKSQASAERHKQALDALGQAWDKISKAFAASSFAPAPVEDLGAGLANFVKDLQSLGALEHAIIDPIIAAFQSIPAAFNAVVAQVSATIEAWVTTPIGNAWQWLKDSFQSALDWMAEKGAAFLSVFTGGGGAASPAGGGIPGRAGGGLLGGRGTGTSDSNLAWVSRGEHIMPARAVSQPGVLALLEALRFSGGNLRAVLNGMGRFALGGMVAPRLSIPAFAGSMNHVSIHFPGLPEISGLRASSAVVDQLRNAAAMAQVRSGGRKPSRYS
jgi:tetratricopeptide (TPR) repeat protein